MTERKLPPREGPNDKASQEPPHKDEATKDPSKTSDKEVPSESTSPSNNDSRNGEPQPDDNSLEKIRWVSFQLTWCSSNGRAQQQNRRKADCVASTGQRVDQAKPQSSSSSWAHSLWINSRRCPRTAYRAGIERYGVWFQRGSRRYVRSLVIDALSTLDRFRACVDPRLTLLPCRVDRGWDPRHDRQCRGW